MTAVIGVGYTPDEHLAVAQLLRVWAEHGEDSPEAISLLATINAEFNVQRIIYCLVDALVVTIETLTDGEPGPLIEAFGEIANNMAERHPNMGSFL